MVCSTEREEVINFGLQRELRCVSQGSSLIIVITTLLWMVHGP